MQPNDFTLIVAAARKEAEKLIKSADRKALQSFAPVFEIRGRNLWMTHGGVTADLGLVVAEKGDLGPRGVDGNNGRDGLDGKAGIDGRNGADGRDGSDGRDGRDGIDGKDGRGIAKAYVSDAGYLIIEFTDGQKITAGYVRGRDGKDGRGGEILFGGASSQGGGATAWDDITDKPTFATVATSGAYADLSGLPTLGTAASAATGDFATAAQGGKADTAVQPAELASYQPISEVLTATTASYTTADQSKLAGISSGATVNSSDATLLARANHTGTQAASTISDFSTAADARVSAGITGKQDALVSGANIKTINGASVLGAGNLAIASAVDYGTAIAMRNNTFSF